MSLNGSIQLANNSLKANQIGLQVVGQNIANANTPGYIRSELQLEPAPTQRNGNLLLGLGVTVSGVIQKIDRFLEDRLRTASSDRASAETQEQAFQQLESLIGELGDTDLSTSLNNFFNSIHEVLNQPDSVPTRNLAVLQGVTLASDINRLDARVREISADLNSRIINAGGEINDLTEAIRAFNIRIAALEGGGAVTSDAVGLRDQRGVALAKLADLVQIQVEEQPSGGVAVFAGGDYLVLEGQRRTVNVVDKSEGGLGHAEIRIDKIDSPLEIFGGELEGLITARDTILGGYLDDLDNFAGTLAFEFNKIFSSGQGLKGFDQLVSEKVLGDSSAPLDAAGLEFTPTSGTFDVLVKNKRTGLTETTTVRVQLDGLDSDTTLNSLVASLDAISGISAEVTGQRGVELASESADSEFSFGNDTSGVLAALGINTFFTGSRAVNLGINQELRDDPAKFAASGGGIGEDADNVERLAAFLDRPLESADGFSLSILYDRMISKVTQASTVTQSVAEGLRVFQSALNSQHMATSGVSLDEEAVKMITFQRSFQASARYINTLAELLDLLVNL